MVKSRHVRPFYIDFTIEFSYLCDASNAIKIVNNVLFDIAQSHVHLSRIKKDNQIFEKALFYNDQTIVLQKLSKNEDTNFISSLNNFIYSGVIHILTGLDHLVFLLGLFFLVNSFKIFWHCFFRYLIKPRAAAPVERKWWEKQASAEAISQGITQGLMDGTRPIMASTRLLMAGNPPLMAAGEATNT